MKLTPRQKECYAIIKKYYERHKLPISLYALRDGMGYTNHQPINYLLDELIKKNKVEKVKRGLYRAI